MEIHIDQEIYDLSIAAIFKAIRALLPCEPAKTLKSSFFLSSQLYQSGYTWKPAFSRNRGLSYTCGYSQLKISPPSLSEILAIPTGIAERDSGYTYRYS